MMGIHLNIFLVFVLVFVSYGIGTNAGILQSKTNPIKVKYKKEKVIETFFKDGGLKKRITEVVEQERIYHTQHRSCNDSCSGKSQRENDKKRPNIVLIIADDLGWNDVGWHNQEVLTPNMDRLARNGLILDSLYVQPICTPSRAAILTGKYPHRLGLQWIVVENLQPKLLPRNETLLPERLKEQGYSTHLIGKWHLGHCSKDSAPLNRGFDSFYGLLRGLTDFYNRSFGGVYDFWKDDSMYFPPTGAYNTDLFTSEATNIIESRKDDDPPMFLMVSHTSPHFPLQVPEKYEAMYPNITDQNRRKYLGMVSSLDESVGKIVSALEKRNIINNTLVVFLSDNGGDYHFGASNLPFKGDKGDLYEGGVKSAGFIYSPMLPKSRCIHKGLIHAVDLFPTLLEIGGYQLDTLSSIDGVSQWKRLQQCQGSGRNEILYGLDDDISHTAGIRQGKYKLILGVPEVYGGVPPGVKPLDPNSTATRLYDLHNDPFERNNLAERKQKKVIQLKKLLDKHRKNSIPAQNQPYVSMETLQKNGNLRLDWC